MGRLNRHFAFHDQNEHFTNANERALIQSLHAENIQINGYEIVFVPRTVVDLDKIWGEDLRAVFEDEVRIPVWIQTFEGFNPGGADTIDSFGWMPNDELVINISSIEFQSCVEGRDTPKEGDLIFMELVSKLFEITWVEHEEQFYPLAQQMTYICRCREFKYSHEGMETSDENVNRIEDQSDTGETIDEVPIEQGENPDINEGGQSAIDHSEGSPFGNF